MIRRKLIYAVVIATAGLLLSNITLAQTKKETEVANAVEQLRKAMVDPDSTSLASLTFKELSYGHSSGKIEDQATFIQTLTSGKSDFVSIEITEQTIAIVKSTAIVRHNFGATINDGGKPGTVKIAIMTVWQKDKGNWKMLARQAVRVA